MTFAGESAILVPGFWLYRHATQSPRPAASLFNAGKCQVPKRQDAGERPLKPKSRAAALPRQRSPKSSTSGRRSSQAPFAYQISTLLMYRSKPRSPIQRVLLPAAMRERTNNSSGSPSP